MSQLSLSAPVVVDLTWSELLPHLKGSELGTVLPYLHAEQGGLVEVAAFDGEGVVYRAIIQEESDDHAEWLEAKPGLTRHRGSRRGADGALIVRSSPGLPGHKPRYLSVLIDSPSAGETRVVADLLGKRLQGASRVWVHNASEGDWLDLQFVSDGTVQGYGAEGTLLRRFGPLVFIGGDGWTEDGTSSDFSGGSEAMPLAGSGIRTEWVYFSHGTATRVRLRVLVYE